MLREVREETGLTLTKYQFRAILTFLSDEWETEYIHLYTASEFTGTLLECDEGNLEWIPKSEIDKLKLWEGDKIFFKLLRETEDFFSLKLRYEGEKLVETKDYKDYVYIAERVCGICSLIWKGTKEYGTGNTWKYRDHGKQERIRRTADPAYHG